MLQRIKQILKDIGCEQYEITEETIKTWEFYFIRHKLEQNRAIETKNYHVKVFCILEDDIIGNASGTLSPTLSDQEIRDSLNKLIFEASLVSNPAYSLNDQPLPEIHSDPVDLISIAESYLKCLQSIPETETERINSCEIFVSEIHQQFENSNGISYSVTYPSSMIETVINAAKGQHEIELYRNYTSGICDPKLLWERLSETLILGKDRLLASPTPPLKKSDVVFKGENAVELYEFLISRLNAEFLYRKLSDWTIGETIYKLGSGDPITIFASAHLNNSSHDIPVDEEGAWIKDRYLIRDNIAENTWGSRQMSEYIGSRDSSIVYNFIVSGGAQSSSDLHYGDYLELIEFSDFQVDPVGGDILGEIRLGYWHHEGDITIITGGSVSGSMHDVLPDMRFSKETVQYDTFIIPKETRLHGLNITGITG